MKLAYYLPNETIDNSYFASLAKSDEYSCEQIYQKSGIKYRHKAAPNELTSDLAAKAALNLINGYDIDPASIDMLLLCTQSPDYLQPATIYLLHHKLNLPKTTNAMEINIACSGYAHGLLIAKSLIISKSVKRVLLCTADMSYKMFENSDMAQRILFGDGASATIIDDSNAYKIGQIICGTDGAGFFSMYKKYGGYANPFNAQTPSNTLTMNGPEIFLFAIREVPNLVRQILKANNLNLDDIDYFVFHQANLLILKAIAKSLKLDNSKVIFDIENVGNTSSSSIPIALKRAIENNKIKPTNKVLIAGFGIGLAWSGTIITI